MPKVSAIMDAIGAADERPFDAVRPDPFRWEDERTRREAALQAEMAERMAADEAEDEAERRVAGEFYLSYTEGRILFALVTMAAAPHVTQTPAITVKQWAAYLNIRPTQVTHAFRYLHLIGIPKPPAPIPLDGLLRFLAGQVEAVAARAADGYELGGPEGLFNFTARDWLIEYFETHIGGAA